MSTALPLVRRVADFDLPELIRQVQPSPEELMSLWPPERRLHLVLLIHVDDAGRVDISARMREHDFDVGGPDLAMRVRRVRGDVPVVIERPGMRYVVVPWRSFAPRPQVSAGHGRASSRAP